jgi:hypothetical protein
MDSLQIVIPCEARNLHFRSATFFAARAENRFLASLGVTIFHW